MDFDTSHPAVREYLSLIRLQVLTPLSLLINIAVVVVCAFVAKPSIATVSNLHPTSITPNTTVIGAYVAAVFLGQIGYCLLLVVARKTETKRALTGVGFCLVFANLTMALWAIAWVMQWFLFATILQGLLLLFLLYSNIALLAYHPPDASRPLDTALIHAPLRFFLILPLSILFPLCLFVTLGLTFHPTPSGTPQDYASWHAMSGFGVLLGTNLLGLAVIIIRGDIVWCVAATWVAVSIWSAKPKPAPVYITAILFTVLLPLGLLVAFIYSQIFGHGRVVLPPGDEHPGLYRHGPNSTTAAQQPHGIERGPREVTEENW